MKCSPSCCITAHKSNRKMPKESLKDIDDLLADDETEVKDEEPKVVDKSMFQYRCQYHTSSMLTVKDVNKALWTLYRYAEQKNFVYSRDIDDELSYISWYGAARVRPAMKLHLRLISGMASAWLQKHPQVQLIMTLTPKLRCCFTNPQLMKIGKELFIMVLENITEDREEFKIYVQNRIRILIALVNLPVLPQQINFVKTVGRLNFWSTPLPEHLDFSSS